MQFLHIFRNSNSSSLGLQRWIFQSTTQKCSQETGTTAKVWPFPRSLKDKTNLNHNTWLGLETIFGLYFLTFFEKTWELSGHNSLHTHKDPKTETPMLLRGKKLDKNLVKRLHVLPAGAAGGCSAKGSFWNGSPKEVEKKGSS